MKSTMLKLLAGIVLLVGSLLGVLSLTGHLDHEGTKNVPLLRSFFAPAADEEPAEPVRAGQRAPKKARHQPPRSTSAAPRTGEQAVQHDLQAPPGDGQDPIETTELAALTPELVNEAWQRVLAALAEIEDRKNALDLRERELQILADDVAWRQSELGVERTKIEQLHRSLDARIQQFQEQVKLIRTDDIAALKRNAQTLASFDASKAAELIAEQWKTERGQDEVLRTMEFMDRYRLNEILATMPNELVQDVLRLRTRVVKEATPP